MTNNPITTPNYHQRQLFVLFQRNWLLLFHFGSSKWFTMFLFYSTVTNRKPKITLSDSPYVYSASHLGTQPKRSWKFNMYNQHAKQGFKFWLEEKKPFSRKLKNFLQTLLCKPEALIEMQMVYKVILWIQIVWERQPQLRADLGF